MTMITELPIPKSSWEPHNGRFHQSIQSELQKLDVMLNKVCVTKDIPNFSDMELRALISLT